jgi:hypothetical protein
MTQVKMSGTVPEMLQQMADLIGAQSAEIKKLECRAAATEHALVHVVRATLEHQDLLDREIWRKSLLEPAANMRRLSAGQSPDDAEMTQQFATFLETLARLPDETDKPGLSVMKGGKHEQP